MSDVIQVKYIDATGATPSPEFLTPGELALNRADGVLYYLHTSGVVRIIRAEDISLGATGIISGLVTPTGLEYDTLGGVFVNTDVIRSRASYVPGNLSGVQSIADTVEFSTKLPVGPTSPEIPTAVLPEELINLQTLNNVDLDQGYF